MLRSVAQEAYNGWGRSIKRTLQRRNLTPLRAPVNGVLSATVGVEGAKSVDTWAMASAAAEEVGDMRAADLPA